MKIAVASKNPVKLNAVEYGFEACMKKHVEVIGFNVESGVPDQPLSDEETLTGALNRVENVMNKNGDADFFVGVEGGVHFEENDLFAFAWIVISDGKNISKARTGSFLLPPEIGRLIKEGMELGDADDRVFNQTNSKQQNGAIGLLTDDIVTREILYHQAVILALAPFLNRRLYFQD
ncbi:inosine/xanthosine triphosphatase [Sunxiuqinia sp. A32]|uniref:inosine/xanthosine triphosphatase n=1 Tax=Sunxiuqinia sp. A32 TaxID=3461496 RepID=UPI004045B1F6